MRKYLTKKKKKHIKNIEIMNNMELEVRLPLLLIVEDNEITLKTIFDYLSLEGTKLLLQKVELKPSSKLRKLDQI